MKKYCLTDCFKRKMSKGWDKFIQSVVIFLMTIGFIIIVILISILVGWIAVYLGIEMPKNANYGGMGFLIIMMTGVAYMVLYLVYSFIKASSKSVSTFIKKRYEGEPYKCSIFEECKKEPSDNESSMR